MERTLSHARVKRFYDRFGMKQDRHPFEARALQAALMEGRFMSARAVFEFGCGTGKAALELLNELLPRDAVYLGVDISETMVDITNDRLERYGPRARAQQTSGAMLLPAADGSFDRFLSTYVLDLLSADDIRRLLREAHRILQPDGILVLASLTHGRRPHERLLEALWRTAFAVRPAAVGGCRPINVGAFVTETLLWSPLYHDVICQFGLCSEVVVARRLST